MTAAGAKDTEQSNIEAIRRTAAWLAEQGATVDLAIEDPNGGHGALMLNPNNAKRLLDLFFAEMK